jgi:hypothetical protein
VTTKDGDRTEELLQDLLILELAQAGVPSHEIRKVVRVQMARVTRIAKCIARARKERSR